MKWVLAKRGAYLAMLLDLLSQRIDVSIQNEEVLFYTLHYAVPRPPNSMMRTSITDEDLGAMSFSMYDLVS